MSLETNIRNALTRIATEIKTVNTRMTGNATGDLTALTTTAKSNLVVAINELKAAIVEGGDGLTMGDVDARIAEIVGAAPATLDTLVELADALGGDANFAATMTTALAARLRFDAVQSLSAGERTQGLANLGAAPAVHNHDASYYTKAEIGDVTANLVTHFEGGLV